jgi:hypothetical protein
LIFPGRLQFSGYPSLRSRIHQVIPKMAVERQKTSLSD